MQPTATTHNHPQPPTTFENYPQPPTTIRNHPQPPTIIHNHPQLFTSIRNRPQPSTTTHSYLQPSTTTHNHPQTHKKAKTCHKHLLRLYHKYYNGAYIWYWHRCSSKTQSSDHREVFLEMINTKLGNCSSVNLQV